jgi:hypothetical protein
MMGLVRKDFMTIGKKIKPFKRIMIVIMFLAILITRKSVGAILIGIALPLFTCSIPIALLNCDEQWKWDRYAIAMPITKKEIVASRYLTCGIILAVSFTAALLLNAGAYFLFHDFSLATHLSMPIIGLLAAVFYTLLIIPANYIFDIAGGTAILITLPALFAIGTNTMKSLGFRIAMPATLQLGIIIAIVITVLIAVLGLLSFTVSIFTYSKRHS